MHFQELTSLRIVIPWETRLYDIGSEELKDEELVSFQEDMSGLRLSPIPIVRSNKTRRPPVHQEGGRGGREDSCYEREFWLLNDLEGGRGQVQGNDLKVYVDGGVNDW